MIRIHGSDILFSLPPEIELVCRRDLKRLGARKIRGNNSYRLPRLASNLDALAGILEPWLRLPEDTYPEFKSVDLGQSDHMLWGKLRDYQQESVDFMLSSPLPGTLLSLSPGLGKTIVTAIALDVLNPVNVLIVVPPILLKSWEEKILQWSGRRLVNLYGKDGSTGWVLTSYGMIRTRLSTYRYPWDVIVFDESTRFKNRDTATYRSVLTLRKSAPDAIVWELSGFPVTKYVDDLWTQFSVIWPKAFTSYWRFAERYCQLERSVWTGFSEVVGSRGDLDFQSEFRDLIFVRNMREVEDLPEFRFETIHTPLNPDQQDMYDQAVNDFLVELESGGQMTIDSVQTRLIRLQQIISNTINLDREKDSSSKHDAVLELLSDESIEKPILIWVHWVKSALALFDRLQPYLSTDILIGDYSDDAERILRDFKSADADVLILGLKVGRHGLDLQFVRTVIYLDKIFEMETYIQSLYRVKRLGLEHSPHVISLKAPGTVDELVEENLAGKALDVHRMSNESLAQLLRSLSR